jgi:multiple sugar transport system permease protein
MTALLLMSLWSVGPAVVIYLAGLRDVPKQLHEAASIDGVGPVGRFFHVVLPMISPVILFNVIIGTINAAQVFAVPLIMTGGGPERSTYFHSMYVYDQAFKFGDMGYASALGVLQFAIILALTGLILLAGRRLVYYRGA